MAQLNTVARLLPAGFWQRWLAAGRYRLQLMPWQLTLGVVLLLGAVVAAWWLPSRYQAVQALERQLAHGRQAPRTAAPAPLTARAALDAFYASLPPETAAASELGRLLEIASAQGIAPDKVEYQLVRNSAAPFSAYQVTLPVRAPYVALQRFINGVLNAMPNAALREVSISRDESADGLVSARLRFALYLGPTR